MLLEKSRRWQCSAVALGFATWNKLRAGRVRGWPVVNKFEMSDDVLTSRAGLPNVARNAIVGRMWWWLAVFGIGWLSAGTLIAQYFAARCRRHWEL